MSNRPTHRALLVIPFASVDTTVFDTTARRSLVRGDVTALACRQERLTLITQHIGAAPVGEGLAALRLWGQTGQRPAGWIAGADPVYLEPRLDHLVLHHLGRRSLSSGDLSDTRAALSQALGNDVDFFSEGTSGYVRAAAGSMETPSNSSLTLDGCEPSPHMPAGAGAETYQRLQSEIQMTLHQSPMQARRAQNNQPPLNALWLWGGGESPALCAQELPRLFSEDPMLRGYWRSAEAQFSDWPGSISRCLEQAGESFVAILPSADDFRDDHRDDESQGESAPAQSARVLTEAIHCIRNGRIGVLTCLFADGVAVSLRKHHRFRFWRRAQTLTDNAAGVPGNASSDPQ